VFSLKELTKIKFGQPRRAFIIILKTGQVNAKKENFKDQYI